MIPEAAIEAAAKAFASDADPWGIWGECSESYRKFYRDRAKPILEAAAPHMLAAAWEDGEAAGQDNADSNRGHNIEHKPNPYRPTP